MDFSSMTEKEAFKAGFAAYCKEAGVDEADILLRDKTAAEPTFFDNYSHYFNKFYNPWSNAWSEPSTDWTEWGIKNVGRGAGAVGIGAGAAAAALGLGAPAAAAAPVFGTAGTGTMFPVLGPAAATAASMGGRAITAPISAARSGLGALTSTAGAVARSPYVAPWLAPLLIGGGYAARGVRDTAGSLASTAGLGAARVGGENIGNLALMGLGIPIAAGLAAGGGLGWGAAKVTEPKINEDDLRAQEIERAYRIQAQRMKSRRDYEKYRKARDQGDHSKNHQH